MTLKQRVCGFKGHKSKVLTAWVDGVPSQFRLKCQKCGYKTKWFKLENRKQDGKL